MKDEEHIVTPIACFNTNNGSISINKGEMLPFYRNVERVNDTKYEDVNDGKYEESLDTYRKISGRNPESESGYGTYRESCEE